MLARDDGDIPERRCRAFNRQSVITICLLWRGYVVALRLLTRDVCRGRLPPIALFLRLMPLDVLMPAASALLPRLAGIVAVGRYLP